MENFNGMMRIFNLVIGAWATYSAISGKGMAYKSDYPADIQEAANKMLRIVLWIVGPTMLVLTGLIYLFEHLDAGAMGAYHLLAFWLDVAIIAIVVITIIAYIIVFRVRFGKRLK